MTSSLADTVREPKKIARQASDANLVRDAYPS
jgi:hypothetical protein